MMYGLFEDENRLEAALEAPKLGANNNKYNKYQRVGTAESLWVGYSKSYFWALFSPGCGGV